jgi:Lrp/AsnC family transcriptional regulator for asnA, asnC and gidA
VRVDGHRLQEIARQIAAFEEVIYLAVVSGSYNFLVEVACTDNAHLLQFLTEKLYRVEGVREADTYIYLDIVKEIYTWDPRSGEGQPGESPVAPVEPAETI